MEPCRAISSWAYRLFLFARRRVWLATASTVQFALTAGCESPQSVVDPHGPQADSPVGLWWVIAALGVIIYVGGMLLLGAVLESELASPRDGRAFIIGGGIILPAVVVSGLFIITLFTLRDMAQPNEPVSVTIEVTGHH
jgi:cytochrome c oxidase subunit II